MVEAYDIEKTREPRYAVIYYLQTPMGIVDRGCVSSFREMFAKRDSDGFRIEELTDVVDLSTAEIITTKAFKIHKLLKNP